MLAALLRFKERQAARRTRVFRDHDRRDSSPCLSKAAREPAVFVELLDYLDEHRLPVPGTIHDREGVALHSLAGKPALLFPRLPGKHPSAPNLAQCRAGSTLGQMHKASQHFPGHRPNPVTCTGCGRCHHKVLTHISLTIKH